MFNCDINTLEDYRDKVFQYLPQLVDLDSFDRANQEVDPSDDDDDEEEEPDGNNSDEENRNGFGEDNDDSDLDSTDSDVSGRVLRDLQEGCVFSNCTSFEVLMFQS